MVPCPCTNRKGIRCDDQHCDLAGPGDVNHHECRVCWRRLGLDKQEPQPPRDDIRRYPPKFRNEHPCVHLGILTGETRDCAYCGGAKNIPLVGCAVHGRCTTEKMLAYREANGTWVQVTFCLSCSEYSSQS